MRNKLPVFLRESSKIQAYLYLLRQPFLLSRCFLFCFTVRCLFYCILLNPSVHLFTFRRKKQFAELQFPSHGELERMEGCPFTLFKTKQEALAISKPRNLFRTYLLNNLHFYLNLRQISYLKKKMCCTYVISVNHLRF